MASKFLRVYLPRGAEKPLRPKQDGKLDYKTKPLNRAQKRAQKAMRRKRRTK